MEIYEKEDGFYYWTCDHTGEEHGPYLNDGSALADKCQYDNTILQKILVDEQVANQQFDSTGMST